MTTRVRVTKIGDIYMLPLSDEIFEKLDLKENENVEVVATENEIILRRANDEERRTNFKKVSAEVFEDFKNVFSALAK